MTLEFICSNEISECSRIEIPQGANFYKVKSGKVKFFKVNSFPREKMYLIESSAKEIRFREYFKFKYWIYYGSPTFYDWGGNVLKYEGDR